KLNNEVGRAPSDLDEALIISQDVIKIPEASSENIRSASCVLSKQPQVNASKLACNLENVKILHD
ncbi:14212_t:CDS:2, partial [Funneliformis caledonium]